MSSVSETTIEQATLEDEACPECAGRVLPDGFEDVCQSCGLVVDADPLDRGPEWRAFTATEHAERARCGPPRDPTLHDRGLGSTIGGYHNFNYRQRRVHSQARRPDRATRGRAYAFGELRRLADVLDLPEVVAASACRLFEQAQDDGLAQGLSYEGVSTACLIAAARVHGHACPFDRAEAASRIDERSRGAAGLYRCYSKLVEELGVPVPPPKPETLVGGICRELGLGAGVQTAAERRCRDVDGADVAGRKPSGVAAAAVYLACGREVTQPTVGEAAGCSAVTLRKLMRILEADDG